MKQCYQYALKCLSRREHSIFELRQKLEDRFDNVEDIAAVIHQLIAKNLLSDERFVESYVRMRLGRGYGPRRIDKELQMRGVESSLIIETLKNNEKNFYQEAKKAQCKKFKNGLPKDLKQKMQQMRFLDYRGFTSSQIKMVLGNDDEC